MSPLCDPSSPRTVGAACIAGHRKAVCDLAYMALLRPEAISSSFLDTTLMSGLVWLIMLNSRVR